MKSEAFRDDLAAAQGAGLVGFDPGFSATAVAYFSRFGEPRFQEMAKGPEELEPPTWLLINPKLRFMDLPTAPAIDEHGWPIGYRATVAPMPTARETYAARSAYGMLVGYERASDLPGIAAMAAKNAQPLPEPMVSIAGEQVAESELQAALQLIRQKNAPPANETPRGLLVIAPLDHRFGRWNEV